VAKMAPIVRKDLMVQKASYRPTLEDLHDAQSIHM
jgi:hypothetical protein